MANAMPWSVRGIDPDIREQAVEAAHRSGMSVGEWLNQVLAGNLDEEPEEAPPRSRASRRSTSRRDEPRREDTRFDDLGERLERLGRNRASTASLRQREPEPDNSRVLDLIENAVTAIERLERKQAKVDASPEMPAPMPPASSLPSHLAQVIDNLERRLSSVTEAQEPPRAAMMPERQSGARAGQFVRPTRAIADFDPGLVQAVAEIDQRRRDLDHDRSPQQARATQRGRAAQESELALDTMRQQLDTLLQRIDDMRVQAKPEATRLQDRLEQIAGRMDEWKSRPAEDLALIRRDIASLAAAIETLSPQRLMGMVESAVQTVAERSILSQQNRLPERILVPIAEVHQDIRQILADMNNAGNFNQLTRDVGLVAKRLDEIGRQTGDTGRLDDIMRETDAIKALIGQAMRAQPLEGLVHHIEALGRKIEALQRDPRKGDESAVLDQIQEIRDRIDRIDPKASFSALEQRLSAISAIETRLGAIAGFGEKLDEIARDVSRMAKDKQPLPQLDSIASRLERIDRVLDSSSAQPIAGLDVLAEKLDRLGTSLEKAAQPASPPDELVGLLERLSSRMADVEAARSDNSSLDALQDEIMRLGQRLDKPGTAPSGMDGLEKAIATLMGQFDTARSDLRDAAAQAAENAARDAIRSMAREESSDTLAAEGLLLLKRDLGEFKSAQSDADRRTRQTLEQLHSTLETLVGRLSSMETPPASAAPTRADISVRRETPIIESRPESVVVPPARPAMPAAQPVQAQAPQPAAAKPAMRPNMPSADVLDDSPIDFPLEPGQRPGSGSAPATSPAAPIAGAPGTTDPRSAFIAAARRAAQSAAERSQEVLAEEPAEPKKSRFRFSLGKGSAAKPEASTPDAALPVAVDPPRSLLVRARKPMLLGLAAVLFAVIGARVLLHKGDADSTVSTQPPAVEQPFPDMPAPATPERTGSIKAPDVPPAPGKRETRLVDSSAITQSDPLIVGSVGGDGQANPLETGRAPLVALGQDTRIPGQERLRDAAIGGNPAAMFELGARLADGRGVTRDPKLAVRWFEQAAAAGHAPSQYRLASLHREGRGVPKDAAIAFQWFDRAAAQGHVLAMHNAGVLLAEGVHGAPDYAGAALWFRRAAEHGVKDSQFNVAILFARGLGVNQDMGEAYRWFSLAAAQGDPDSIKKRDDVAARLSKEQLAKEKERLKAFTPSKPNPASNEVAAWDKSPAAMFPPVARTAPVIPATR